MASKDALSEEERRRLTRIRGMLLSQGMEITEDGLVTAVLRAALQLDPLVLDQLVRSGLKKDSRRKGRIVGK